MKYRWGNFKWETYKPKINRYRQALLFTLVLGDVIIPMTFGIGIIATKFITKLNPLFIYK